MIDKNALSLVSAKDIQLGQNSSKGRNCSDLRRGRIHELLGASADSFAAITANKLNRTGIWIGLGRDVETLSPLGLAPFFGPAQLLIVEAVSRGEILWAADVALRAPGQFTVIIDMPDRLSLKESRRLQLAAEAGNTLGLVILHTPPGSSAAQTRWQCEPTPDGPAAWMWRCIKGKHGEHGSWRVHWQGGQNAEDTLHMATAAAP